MTAVQIDYLHINVVRRGRRLWRAAYYRRGMVRQRLLGPDGKSVDPDDTEALLVAWKAAHEAYDKADERAAKAADERAVRPRSIAALIRLYRASPEWEEKAPETKRDYEKALRPLENDWGHLPVGGLKRHHIGDVRDRYAWRQVADPENAGKTIRVRNARQANRVITVLSILMTYASDRLGWRPDNPALRPRRLRQTGDGYRPWTRDEFVQFMSRADAEWKFNALFALLTAQRGQDQVTTRWADYDGTSLTFVQKKGRSKSKEPIVIEVHPVLKDALDRRLDSMATRSPRPLTILMRPDSKPWSDPGSTKKSTDANAFQKAAGAAIRAAGLEGPVWHGLRASAASWGADGEATEPMLQALLGHKTPNMTRKYARGANQKRMASGAVRAIVVPIGEKKRPG
jgi:integrase